MDWLAGREIFEHSFFEQCRQSFQLLEYRMVGGCALHIVQILTLVSRPPHALIIVALVIIPVATAIASVVVL